MRPLTESILAAANGAHRDKYLDRKLELESYFHRLMNPKYYDYQISLEEDGTRLHILWNNGTRVWKVDYHFGQKFPYLKKVEIAASRNHQGTLNVHLEDTMISIKDWKVWGDGFHFLISKMDPGTRKLHVDLGGERSQLFLGFKQKIDGPIHPSNAFWCREVAIRITDPAYLNKCIKAADHIRIYVSIGMKKQLAQELDCLKNSDQFSLIVNSKNKDNLERLGLFKTLKLKQLDIL